MNLDKQIEQFQIADGKFSEVSTTYEIHNTRIHAMINYFENIRSVFSKAVAKKEKYQITKSKFGRQLSNDLNFPIAPGNPGFQLNFVDTFVHLSTCIITEFESTNKHFKESTIKQLTNLVNGREKKFKEIMLKYNEAVDAYQKAQSNFKSCQQNLNSALMKLEQTQQNWEAQQNQGSAPQKSGFNLFHKFKPSKSKTDISGAIQNYRKGVRSAENSIYALNGAYSNFLTVAKESIHSLESDTPNLKFILRATLYDLSRIYIDSSHLRSTIHEYKNKTFQNEDNFLQTWENDFIQFVQKAQISRFQLNTIVFNQVELSSIGTYQTNKFIQPEKYYDFPIGFAIVIREFPFVRGRYLTSPNLDKKDANPSSFSMTPDSNLANTPNGNQEPRRQSFNTGNPPKNDAVSANLTYLESDLKNSKHYLSVKEGQRVYIYNNLHDDWVLASTSINSPRKYLLSSCLAPDTTDNCGMAIVKRIKLGAAGNYLSVYPGELLAIIRRDVEVDTELCSNIKGETGLVSKDCIIMLND